MIQSRIKIPWGARVLILALIGVLCASSAAAQEPEGEEEGVEQDGADQEIEGDEDEAADEEGAEDEQVEGDSGPVDGPEVPEDEWMEDEGDQESTLDGPRLPVADLEAPEDADPEFEAQLDGYRAAYERYATNIEDYQQAIENLVSTEFDRRMAEIDSLYDPRIRAAEMLETQQRGEAIASLEQFLAQYPDDSAHTPDALFRLALLYDQQEAEEFAEKQEAYFDSVNEQDDEDFDEDAEFEEPPMRSYEDSQEMFARLISDWPDYRGIDLAYYFMAHIQWEQMNWDKSRDLAAELIRRAPDSDFVPHAWLMIGEYHFEYADRDGTEQIRDNLQLALEAFREAGSDNGRENLTDANYVRAVYSWAWTHYRLEDYPEAIGVFRKVVELVDLLAQETGEKRTLLREDALSHLGEIIAMEDWDLSGTPSAQDTVMNRILDYMDEGDAYEREVLVVVGEELFTYLRYDEAIDVYQHVLQLDPLHPDNPEIHSRIVLALHRDYREEEAFAVRREMIDYYGNDSSWHIHQSRQGNEGAIRKAENMVRDYLLMAATWYHEQAQMTRNEALASRDAALLSLTEEQYAMAADAYREFLQQYPNDREIFQWNFYFAETLYYSAQYEQAFEQYQVVRELDIPNNPFQEVSAFNAIQALEFMMRGQIEEGRLTPTALGGSDMDSARDAADEMDEGREFEDERDLQATTVEGQPIPDIVYDYVTAMDRYVVLGLENEGDAYLGAKFAFQAAKVYYDFLHYEEARTRFGWVVETYPEHEVAYLAGSLILETLRQENDFEGMTEWAERLEDVIRGDQAEAVRAEVREFRLTTMFRSAEEMFAEERYDEAAAEFERLARDAPDHRLAPRARNNAATVYEVAGKYDKAIEQYEELFQTYPEDDMAGRAVYRVAVNAEWLFDFDKAARHYQLFYDTYRGPTPESLEALSFDIEESREQSLSKSAHLQLYQQQFESAAQTFEEFFETYPESEDASEMLWSASTAWERGGDEQEMIRVLNQYLDEYENDRQRAERLMRAHMRMAEMYEERGDTSRADQKYEVIVDQYDDLMGGDDDEESQQEPPPGENSLREMAAKSRFMLIERDFYEWDEIAIEGPLAQQERRLKQRVDGAKELRAEYAEVFAYQNLDWNMAAFFRRANVQHRMASALYEVPNPFEDGSEEYWAYQDILDDILFPMEEAAIKAYEETITRARTNDPPIVNEWTEATLEALHDFQPADYPFYEEEKRPRRKSISLGVPLMSQESYEKRMERLEREDDQAIEAPDFEEEADDDEEGEESQ